MQCKCVAAWTQRGTLSLQQRLPAASQRLLLSSGVFQCGAMSEGRRPDALNFDYFAYLRDDPQTDQALGATIGKHNQLSVRC